MVVEFLILTLATWRLASLLAAEEGPWGMLTKLRHLVGVRYGEHGVPYGENWLAKGMICVWCSSVWFGLFWALLFCLWPYHAVVLALPFALSAGAIAVDRVVA